MNIWLLLVISLPTENATLRQRAWRALKASGAAVLRDGVYLLPGLEHCRATLDGIATEVLGAGGSARVLPVQEPPEGHFVALFDRSADYAVVLSELETLRQSLSTETVQATLRQARKLRKTFTQVEEIDFFPGEAQRQVDHALRTLELACARALSPDEPQPQEGSLARLEVAAFQNRVWATRQRPWVDRLASAWLIRRFIDTQARLLWLASPTDCPPDALGFDFDGATFSHTDGLVTFEVLATRFGLVQAPLARLGLLVHGLDAGGVQSPEAPGIECVLAGLRDSIPDDDQLLRAASAVFDSLLVSFEKGLPAA